MKALVIGVGLVVSGATWSAPPDLLVKAIQGASKPYQGIQVSSVATATGEIEAKIRVYGNGKGSTLREYLLGDTVQVRLLTNRKAAFQEVGQSWSRLANDYRWDARERASILSANYHISIGSEVKYLGLKAKTITIKPKQSYNPSRLIVIDPETGLILKDVLYASDGKLRSSTRFQSLKYQATQTRLFIEPLAPISSSSVGPDSFLPRSSKTEVESLTGSSVSTPSYVPAGYRPVLYGTMTTRTNRLMPAVRYSDGLSSFTIFQRGKGQGEGAGNGRNRRGRGWAQSSEPDLKSDIQRSVVFINGPRNFLLIGDLAESELRKIARSLR